MTDTINEALDLAAWFEFAEPKNEDAANAARIMRTLVADMERTRAELAAARAAMPTNDDIDALREFYRGIATREEGDRARAWLCRIFAYHAAHPAAYATNTTTIGGDDA